MKIKSKIFILVLCLLVLNLGGATYGYLTIKSGLLEQLREKVVMTEAFGSSVRRYLVENQRPIALQYISSFYPELMSSSYTVRKVMGLFAENVQLLYFRQPATNPRNSLNNPSPFEKELLETFRREIKLKKWEGYFQAKGEKYYGVANPRRVTRDCLLCHGSPEKAPAKLVEAYGREYGFGYQNGDLVGLELFAVSTVQVDQKVRQQALPFLILFSLLGFLVTLFLYFSLRKWLQLATVKEGEER